MGLVCLLTPTTDGEVDSIHRGPSATYKIWLELVHSLGLIVKLPELLFTT